MTFRSRVELVSAVSAHMAIIKISFICNMGSKVPGPKVETKIALIFDEWFIPCHVCDFGKWQN